MFYRRQLHVLSRGIACLLFVFGSLILQGCGDNSPPEAETQKDSTTTSADGLVAREKYYADLDAKYPQGRPALTTGDERVKDEAYKAELKQLGNERTKAADAYAAAQKAADDYRALLVKNWTAAVEARGMKVSQSLINEKLAQHAHYQSLLKAVAEAEEANRKATGRVYQRIQQQTHAAQKEYDQMLSTVEAQVKEAGLPTRAETQKQEFQKATQKVVQ